MEKPTRLNEGEITERLLSLRGWTRENGAIMRTVDCVDFKEARAFVDRVADAAEQAGHHPDIHLERASRVRLVLTTHSAGGLTANDFAMAERLAHVVPERAAPS